MTHKVQARLLPLNGKYYGSKIEVSLPDDSTSEMRIWLGGTSDRSKREIEYANDGETLLQDNHEETDFDLWVAEAIVAAINGKVFKP